ncbi:MAG: right-handed parallel beta-helix repeat-containing protein [Myxococcota bacterium]
MLDRLESMVRAAWRPALAGLATLTVLASPVPAAPPIGLSSDTRVALGAASVVVADEGVALDSQTGIVVAAAATGSLPESTDLIGLGRTLGGASLLAFDTTVELTGGLVARPGDVVAWDGATHTRLFDATAAGVAAGVRVDAVSLSPASLALSFDTDVLLPGPLAVADEDLVRWDGARFERVFDGSTFGIDPALDVDAVDDRGAGTFLLSFDTGGRVGDFDFADEDVLFFDGARLVPAFDGSSADPDWVGADLDALQVPEPTGSVGFAGATLGLLAALRRRRLRRRPTPPSIAPAGMVHRHAEATHTREITMATARLALVLSILLAPIAALASDGVLEINQTCATLTGCFSGDAAGFPVTIDGSAGSSYLLTSDLDVADAATDGILITTSDVTIDLNGFALHGPTVCSGTPTTCAPTGLGSGIRADRTSGSAASISVRNGSIEGFGLDGLLLREDARVDEVRVRSNGSTGIQVDASSVVTNCVAERNGSDGIKAIGTGIVSGCTTAWNHARGIYAGPGSTVTGSTAYRNDGIGIVAGDGSPGAKGVEISGNAVRENGLDGIFLSVGGLARGNAVVLNGDDGIDAADGSLIVDNSVVSNGDAAADDGIECDAGCAVRGNVVRSNLGLGLNLGVGSAYSGNTITANAAGTVVGGIARSENYCDGAAAPACP